MFKMLQRFYDAGGANGGSGGGSGGDGKKDDEKDEDKDDGKDDGKDDDVKTELEGLKKELEDLKAKNGEKDKTLESLQKQIDKTKDTVDKKELEDLRDNLLRTNNENIVLKLEAYKIKAIEKEKVNAKFSELIATTPNMTTETIDGFVKVAKEIQEVIKTEIITVNQEGNIAFKSGGKKKAEDFHSEMIREEEERNKGKEIKTTFR